MRRKIKRRGRELLFRNLKSYRSAKARFSVFLNLSLGYVLLYSEHRAVKLYTCRQSFRSAAEIHLETRNSFKEHVAEIFGNPLKYLCGSLIIPRILDI